MKFQIQITVHGHQFRSCQEFNSRWDAQTFINTEVFPNAFIICDVPPLKDWNPDDAEIDLLNTLGSKEDRAPVTAIKFIRTKAGCGLKEAKDYFDNHFREDA